MAEMTLESFLIKLGYQVDQASQKTFVTAMGDAAKGVAAIAAAATAMAVAVAEAVRRTAASMAQLNYSAQLAGSTTQAMKQNALLAQSVGASYEGMLQSQVKFGELMRSQPWLRGVAEDVLGGQKFKDSADFFRKAADQYHKLVQQFGEGSDQVIQFGLQLKILGEDTSFVVLADKNRKAFEETLKHNEVVFAAFGERYQRAQDAATSLTLHYTHLSDTIDHYYKTAFVGLMEYLDGVYQSVNDWLLKQAPKFEAWMNDLETKMKEHNWEGVGQKIGEAVGQGIRYIIDHIQEWFTAGENVGAEFAAGFVEGVIKGIVGANLWEKIKDVVKPAAKAAAEIPGSVFSPTASVQRGLHWLLPGVVPSPDDQGEGTQLVPGGGAGGHYQHGGIVPASLHPGEMVLPKPISEGLQQFYGGGGGGSDDFSMIFEDLGHWLNGDTAFQPVVSFAMEVFDKLTDVFEEALRRVWPDAANTNPAGPGGGGGGAGAGAGGAAGGGASGGAAGESPPNGAVPGGPNAGESNSSTAPPVQSLAEARKRFADEMARNPALREKFLQISASEQSDPMGNLAVMESLMNRADLRGKSLESQARFTNEPGGYYDARGAARGAAELAKNRKFYEDNLAKVLAGSNVSNWATDNASGTWGLNRIKSGMYNLASSFGGEYFATPGTGVPRDQANFPAWKASRGGAGPQVAGTPGPTQVVAPTGEPGSVRGIPLRAGASPSTTALQDIMRHAFSAALPAGYTVEQTSGERFGADEAGHKAGRAGDFQIYGPGGTPIRNRGLETAEMYRRVAVQGYLYAMQKYGPEAAKQLGWGGHFGTDRRSGGGEADTMHFDWMYKGWRGRIGDYKAEYNEALKLFHERATEMKQAVQDAPKPVDTKFGTGLNLGGKSQQNVDNSTNTTVIHGVTNYHDAIPARVTADRSDSYRKRNQGMTFVA